MAFWSCHSTCPCLYPMINHHPPQNLDTPASPTCQHWYCQVGHSAWHHALHRPDTVKWVVLHDTMHHTDLAIFGKKTPQKHDWFKARLNWYPSLQLNTFPLVNIYSHLWTRTRRFSGLPRERQSARHYSDECHNGQHERNLWRHYTSIHTSPKISGWHCTSLSLTSLSPVTWLVIKQLD